MQSVLLQNQMKKQIKSADLDLDDKENKKITHQ